MIKSLSIWWLLRRKIAERNADTLVCKFNEMKHVRTPWLLQLLGLEIIEAKYTNPENNPYTSTGAYWLIRKKSKIYDMSKPMHVWRIRSSADQKAPVIIWEKAS